MRSGLKMLLAGIIFGFMAVFAFIGVKSLVNDPQKNQVQVQPPDIETSTILGQPTPAAGNRTGTASPSLADQGTIDAADQGSVQPTLVGEPDESADGQPADPATQAEPATDTNIASPESPASTPDTDRTADADTGQVAAGAATGGTADTDTTAATPANTATDTAPAQPDRSGSGGAELIDEYGALELSLTDPADPQRKPGATFIIRDVLDMEVASMENTDSATFDLPPGIYEVTVVAEGKKNARMVEITANQVARERFELPNPPAPASSVQTGQVDRVDSTPTPDGADATPAPPLPDTPPPAAAVDADTGRVQVFVRAGGSNAALKANIYIQQPNGVHVAKGSYADNVEFTLQPGRYRITAKTKGKQDVVRDINLVAGQVQQQIIVMESLAAQTPNRPAPPPEGTLNLVLRSPPGAAEGRGRFVVTDSEGQRVARVGGVANAQIKLEPGS
nr:hypothetical protein [Thiolinea sp.]